MATTVFSHDTSPTPFSQGKFDEANGLFQRSLDIRRKVFGPDHQLVAKILGLRARMLQEQVGDSSRFG